MAKKKRHIASFGQVADTNFIDTTKDDHENVNKIVNIDDNNNVNKVVDKNENDEIDMILRGKRKVEKVQKGIYFDPDVARALDKLVKKKLQSDFVNAAVRQVMKEKGLM